MVRLLRLDWATLADVARSAVESDPAAFSSSTAELNQWTDDEWQAYAGRYCADTAAAFLEQRGQAVVGMVGVEVMGDAALITNLWVQPSFRRHGVARALMGEAEAWATCCGASRVMLTVTPGLNAAVAFYRALGYEGSPDNGFEKRVHQHPRSS